MRILAKRSMINFISVHVRFTGIFDFQSHLFNKNWILTYSNQRACHFDNNNFQLRKRFWIVSSFSVNAVFSPFLHDHPISVVYGKITLRPATFQPMKHFWLFGQLEIVWRNNDWYQIKALDLYFHFQAQNLQICLFWAMFFNVKVWWTFFGFPRKSSNFNLEKSTPNAH